MTPVYAWPPVGVIGAEWSVVDPVAVSRSLLSGRRFVSAAQRRRRVAQLRVNGIGRDAAGYVEALKDYLRGGVGLVRLHSRRNGLMRPPIADALRRAERVGWTAPSDAAAWTAPPGAVTWFSGAVLAAAAVSDAGFPALSVSGLPPSALVARPGEFVTAYASMRDATGETRRVARPAISDDAGGAVVRVTEAFTLATVVRADLGIADTAAFEALNIPRALQPLGQQFTYDWSFREVFADEVGGFEEIDPWI